jgi:hypothetical protein
MYFVFIHENRKMKLVEIVLRRGESGSRTMMMEINLTKIYCMLTCKYQNVSPIQLLYANKIIKRTPGTTNL